ncbi:MAG TPA: DNA (cytosine-5-)-methyltransferase [bacterium]|nr:DNA (cytosine-5-)-methyltransferase [bacterium]
MTLTVGSMFSGIGGLDLGLQRAGLEIKWQIENEPYCIKVLEKHWPGVKRYGNIKEINGKELEPVDIIAGGVPCQGFSVAGARKGLKDDRSGLFFEMSRIISETRPKYVLIENVPGLISKGLGTIIDEFRIQGYKTLRPILIEAASVGAPHKRERIFILAYSRYRIGGDVRITKGGGKFQKKWSENTNTSCGPSKQSKVLANPKSNNKRNGHEKNKTIIGNGAQEQVGRCRSNPRNEINSDSKGKGVGGLSEQPREKSNDPIGVREKVPDSNNAKTTRQRQYGGEILPFSEPRGFSIKCLSRWWAVEPSVGRVVARIPNRVDRLKGIGNSVVPQVAEYLGRLIIELDNQVNK